MSMQRSVQPTAGSAQNAVPAAVQLVAEHRYRMEIASAQIIQREASLKHIQSEVAKYNEQITSEIALESSLLREKDTLMSRKVALESAHASMSKSVAEAQASKEQTLAAEQQNAAAAIASTQMYKARLAAVVQQLALQNPQNGVGTSNKPSLKGNKNPPAKKKEEKTLNDAENIVPTEMVEQSVQATVDTLAAEAQWLLADLCNEAREGLEGYRRVFSEFLDAIQQMVQAAPDLPAAAQVDALLAQLPTEEQLQTEFEAIEALLV